MDNLVSFGNKRNYEDFKKQIPIKLLPLYDSIRDYCLSLEDRVVEDIRMHRIVFCKSITFRWFADVAPQEESVIIKIQKDRKETPIIVQVNPGEELTSLKKVLKEAFETIH